MINTFHSGRVWDFDMDTGIHSLVIRFCGFNLDMACHPYQECPLGSVYYHLWASVWAVICWYLLSVEKFQLATLVGLGKYSRPETWLHTHLNDFIIAKILTLLQPGNFPGQLWNMTLINRCYWSLNGNLMENKTKWQIVKLREFIFHLIWWSFVSSLRPLFRPYTWI